jgi:5-hydroxyisourate hydrolase-like protein (transthyretin family)
MNLLRHPRRLTLAWMAATAWTLSGCASQNIESYAAQRPTLDLAQYFNGRITAHGIFQDRSGQVVRRFTVDMEGRWDGQQGVLDEHFTYSDGQKDRRIWRLTRHADGRYTGTADDVVGTASGRTVGNAFQWAYTLKLPVDGKVVEVQFDDWMYLVDERVMLNRATMSKFGIRLGEVTLSFQKTAP